MNDPQDKNDQKYLEVALIIFNFLIPFVGLLIALKNYLMGAPITISYIFLLAFIGGNIMTWLIFLLDGKNIKVKLLWTGGILLAVILINILTLV